MIKRRFYKMEHGDRDDASNESSSSSDSEIEVEDQLQEEETDDDDVDDQPPNQDDDDDETHLHHMSDEDNSETQSSPIHEHGKTIIFQKESPDVELPEYVVKRKSILKCRICPKIVSMNEEALNTHLKSKRHARSEKLLNEGRLKTVLNSEGKIDVEDTPAFYARILASSQAGPRKKSKRDDPLKPRKKRMRYDMKKSQKSQRKSRRD